VIGVVVGAVGPPGRLGEQTGLVGGAVEEAGTAAGRLPGVAGDGLEAAGHVGRDLVAGGLVARDCESQALGGRDQAVGRGVPSVPRPAELVHERCRRLSRNCCRMTTAAAWSITGRCLRLSMPPSRR
jgi:hypothetical protein